MAILFMLNVRIKKKIIIFTIFLIQIFFLLFVATPQSSAHAAKISAQREQQVRRVYGERFDAVRAEAAALAVEPRRVARERAQQEARKVEMARMQLSEKRHHWPPIVLPKTEA